MPVTVGVVVLGLALLAWVGQVVSAIAPRRAEAFGLREAADEVEPTFDADIVGEARWDAFTLWTMAVAAVGMIVDAAWWPHFGLVGGGIFVYFAGRGVATRREMQRRGLRIGTPANVRIGLAFLVIWGIMAAVVIVMAAVELGGR